MKQRFLYTITIFLVLTALFLFRNKQKNILPEYQTLLYVEQIMAEQPDSALYILEHLPNPTKLTGEAQALYALLLTQARYKNYIPVTNDSLIRIAENYYLQHPDSLHKAWTFFYAAQIYRDAGFSHKAITYFQKSEQASNHLNNNQLKTLLFDHWSELLLYEMPFDEAILKAQQALYYAEQMQDTALQINILHNLSWGYLLEKNYIEAERVQQQALQLAQLSGNKQKEANSLQALSVTYQNKKQLLAALDAINQSLQLNQNPGNLYPLWFIKGDIFIDLHRYDSARYYLAKDIRYSTLGEKAAHHDIWAKYHEKTGNYKEAAYHLRKYAELTDSLHTEDMKNNLMELQKQYDSATIKNENNQLQAQQQKLYIYIVSIIFISLAGGFIALFFYFRKQRAVNELLQSKDNFTAQLRKQLQDKTLALQDMQESIQMHENILQQHSGNEQQMREQILHTSRVIKKLKQLDDMNQKEKTHSFAPLSDEELRNLSETMNICFNNFTDRLKEKYPELTEADINLCNLIRLGIPQTNILYLMNTNKTALKKRKTRMKREKMHLDESISFDDFLLAF